jgi:hypothetical protein
MKSGETKGSKRVDVTEVGCGVVDGARVCHPVSHVHGGSECHELKETTRVCGSHSLDHGVQDNDWAYSGGDEQRRLDPWRRRRWTGHLWLLDEGSDMSMAALARSTAGSPGDDAATSCGLGRT